MTLTSFQTSPRTPLLTAKEVSEILRVPLATLYKWRTTGGGPEGHFVGRYLRFTQQAVDVWFMAGGNKSSSVVVRMVARAAAKAEDVNRG
ncbi:helix-turn-helix domain-containing protein [Cryobacterium sp. 10S3]|uniref:helix-turn-helix domain-containing protein n=1 Tax=unclassified Cryobacterium TaxID=2649013 RepID=UPI002AC8999E|nr:MULTISPECIES: helix-turn-helix domain-containing protein [unclassified Cryobacterium]MEB0004742.1 helix-turn-helix domain-containing protein [Cryobacterium sp. RTC2.1]MEB0288704.1 helix-turn-helix domain-containing protein [Cryobacterium sp. 10S3]WPX13200.1 helix-turn-helix domain-containing protein [Cryobacterium sp. 10S3]